MQNRERLVRMRGLMYLVAAFAQILRDHEPDQDLVVDDEDRSRRAGLGADRVRAHDPANLRESVRFLELASAAPDSAGGLLPALEGKDLGALPGSAPPWVERPAGAVALADHGGEMRPSSVEEHAAGLRWSDFVVPQQSPLLQNQEHADDVRRHIEAIHLAVDAGQGGRRARFVRPAPEPGGERPV